MSWQAGGLTIEILQGDLTQQEVDAIVNAANNDLELGGGVAGAIARAGGPLIQTECRAIGPIEVGDAAITTGGKLPARFVIHAASMPLGGRTSAESLRGSTRRSLEIANQRGLRSIAFPAVGTGIARFPLEECAQIMLDEVVAMSRNPASLREVRFVLFGADAESAFRDEASRRLVAGEQPGKEDRGEERQRNHR
ncbi:MAG: macro domain-containing protein [Candidatus Dormibacteraeota bacterium]|nr:macro domain-containing protein [Candidatus Dormibacteraeota bacterium]